MAEPLAQPPMLLLRRRHGWDCAHHPQKPLKPPPPVSPKSTTSIFLGSQGRGWGGHQGGGCSCDPAPGVPGGAERWPDPLQPPAPPKCTWGSLSTLAPGLGEVSGGGCKGILALGRS